MLDILTLRGLTQYSPDRPNHMTSIKSTDTHTSIKVGY